MSHAPCPRAPSRLRRSRLVYICHAGPDPFMGCARMFARQQSLADPPRLGGGVLAPVLYGLRFRKTHSSNFTRRL